MKLWRIWQGVNNGYDTYDSAVVAAESEELAKRIHPSKYAKDNWHEKEWDEWDGWAPINEVHIEYIGLAATNIQQGVIVASFNAG